ncbi:hypothetical protein SeLEV6574_g02309 [Synchytrium endobioticum]|uniref:Uncharacterized protein n=1 Tax=Synchytrium endobioticum TaxID=286115 RepID=A0A507D8S6_9FUNG|nr:hypothetical protein SeLEV6574_g02309 [Synchytrium endobioticum]
MDGSGRTFGVSHNGDHDNEWASSETSPLLAPAAPPSSSSNRPYPIKTWSAGSTRAMGLHAIGTGPLSGLPLNRPRPSSLYLPSPWQDFSSPSSRPSTRRAGLEILFRKSRNYDDVSSDAALQDQALESTGYRIWYKDYSTIDWIHDLIKERVRLRQLRSIKGFYGFLLNNIDAAQAWILVFLIAISSGFVASLIDIGQEWLTGIKNGYCSNNVFLSRHACCEHGNVAAVLANTACDAWIPWNDPDRSPFGTHELLWSYLVYVAAGAAMATIAAVLVRLTADFREIHDDSSDRSSPLQSSVVVDPDTIKSKPRKIVYHSAGSGIPEVKTILSGFVIRGFLGFKTLVVKSVGLMLSVSSGLSVGKEGPIVHIACCVGNVLSRFFKKYARNEGKRREILSSSAAAGVAVAFGSPIGGVLFSLEEVSYYFPSKTLWKALFCALIATVTVKTVNPIGNGKLTMFEVSYTSSWYFFEIPVFVMLGIICGCYGALFIKCNMWWQKLRANSFLRNHPVTEVFVLALATGAINYSNAFARIGTANLVGQLFAQCPENDPGLGNICSMSEMGTVTSVLLQCLVIKAVLTVITFGSKIPAGIFIPNMAVGACVGRLIGMGLLSLHSMYPRHAFFAECPAEGTCITPVIMMEITGTLLHSVPIMLSVLTAKWVADGFGRQSIYDCIIELNNHPFLETKQELLAHNSVSTAQVMDPVVDTIDIGMTYTIEELEDKLDRLYHTSYGSDGGFPLVEGDNVLVGWIYCAELQHALGEARLASPHQPIFFKKPSYLASTSSTPALNFETTNNRLLGSSRPPSLNIITGQVVEVDEEGNDLGIWCNWSPLTVPMSASMDLVVEIFVKLGAKVLLITKGAGGQVCGALHKKKLIHYLKEA